MSDGVPDPPQPRPRKAVSRARQRWSVMVLAGAAESLSSAKQEKLQVTTEGLGFLQSIPVFMCPLWQMLKM